MSTLSVTQIQASAGDVLVAVVLRMLNKRNTTLVDEVGVDYILSLVAYSVLGSRV